MLPRTPRTLHTPSFNLITEHDNRKIVVGPMLICSPFPLGDIWKNVASHGTSGHLGKVDRNSETICKKLKNKSRIKTIQENRGGTEE
jgi:hypothetical protein